MEKEHKKKRETCGKSEKVIGVTRVMKTKHKPTSQQTNEPTNQQTNQPRNNKLTKNKQTSKQMNNKNRHKVEDRCAVVANTNFFKRMKNK